MRSSGRNALATLLASPATAPKCSTTCKNWEDTSEPVCIMWGDRDHRAPDEVLNAYRAVVSRKNNVEVHIFPGVQHGYMMHGMPKAFDPQAREFSMMRAVAILDCFHSRNVRKPLREAS